MVRLRQMFRAKIFVLLLLFVVVNHIGQSSNEPLDDCASYIFSSPGDIKTSEYRIGHGVLVDMCPSL